MYHRLNPFYSSIKERYLLTKSGSSQQTYHLVLSWDPQALPFKVGDAVGIYGNNDPDLITRILNILEINETTIVFPSRLGKELSIKEFLSKKANISKLNASCFKLLASDSPSLETLQNAEKRNYYLQNYDVLSFLEEFKGNFIQKNFLDSFVETLPPLLPRFYSIACSPLLFPKEIHLIVSLSTYNYRDQKRYGVTSYFLTHLAELQKTEIPCYIQPTASFTLPMDRTLPIIMVGVGTGIAPFRSFLQERKYLKAPGKNWLFFGNRQKAYDFFYENEWLDLVRHNQLILNTSFSRDQDKKIYVQDSLYQNGQEIWKWLQQGSYFYVCGQADPMSKNVEQCFLSICKDFGNLSEVESKLYLQNLRKEKRYLIDVY